VLLDVDGASAFGRAAFARNFVDVLGKVVIHSEFFPFFDVASRHVKDVALGNQSPNIGVATMVDVFGAATPDGTIDSPITVKGEQINHGTLLIAALPCLPAIDFLPEILNYLSSFWNVLICKDAMPVDAGRPNRDFETGVLRINLWSLLGLLGLLTRCHFADCKRKRMTRHCSVKHIPI
jgi:hypothetical protein